jgi:hypothetical protein
MAEEQLDRLLAENAIRRLISAYCDAVGRLDADAAGRLFAPDARIRIADFPELAGREAITEGMRQTFAASAFLDMKCDTGLIDVDGDRARSRLSVFEVNRRPGEDALGLIFGFYEDEYARLEEGWRFHRRRYTLRLRALAPAAKLQQAAKFIPGFSISA